MKPQFLTVCFAQLVTDTIPRQRVSNRVQTSHRKHFPCQGFGCGMPAKAGLWGAADSVADLDAVGSRRCSEPFSGRPRPAREKATCSCHVHRRSGGSAARRTRSPQRNSSAAEREAVACFGVPRPALCPDSGEASKIKPLFSPFREVGCL